MAFASLLRPSKLVANFWIFLKRWTNIQLLFCKQKGLNLKAKYYKAQHDKYSWEIQLFLGSQLFRWLFLSPVTNTVFLSLIGSLLFDLTHDWLVVVFCGPFKASKFAFWPEPKLNFLFLVVVMWSTVSRSCCFCLKCGTSFMSCCSVSTLAL